MDKPYNEANIKAACETKAQRGLAPDSPAGCTAETPPREVLLDWIDDAERRLIEQLHPLPPREDEKRAIDKAE